MLRVGVWPGVEQAALGPLRGEVALVEQLPRHRRPWLFWPRRLTSPLLAGAGAVEAVLSSWPAWLLDAAIFALRAGRRWPMLAVALLPLIWLAFALSQMLLAASRILLAPVRAYEALAGLMDAHPSMLLSPEEQVLQACCDLWIVGPGFPYPTGVKAVSVVDDAPARMWAAAIHRPGTPLIDTLRSASVAPVDPLPALLAAPASTGLPHVHLFLPAAYRGGTWESAQTLARGLVEVNRARRRMTLSLAVPTDQSLDGLDVPADELAVERILPRRCDGHEVPFSPSLVKASAWFALADRFTLPLLPARPYGLILHDVIHRFVPESYPLDFHRRMWPALRETVRGAARVIATTQATRGDIIEAFGLLPGRVALVPVACEPGRRFASLVPATPPLDGPFVLNPTNAAPHKGAEVMLSGFALLRRRIPTCPPLVLCGNDTHRLDPSSPGPVTAYWSRVRRLVSLLGLRVGVDVFFLGYVDDAGLLGLLRGAAVVVNAARHDNGTFALIEAHHLGRPAVSSRYPAAVELYQRFGVPVGYFDPGCPRSLADALEAALGRAVPLAAPPAAELGHRRFAERVYEVLLEMAEEREAQAAA